MATRAGSGRAELAGALLAHRGALWAAAAVSGIVNVLALTGSIYMLQVYDRVVGSRSVPTLVALSTMMVAAYVAQGWFDSRRTRILSRVAANADAAMRERIAHVSMRLPLLHPSVDATQPVRDLDTIRAFAQGGAPSALFDLPWLPVYMALMFALHPLLGWYAIAAALAMSAVTLLAERMSKPLSAEAAKAGTARGQVVDAMKRNAESIRAMGLSDRIAGVYALAAHRSAIAQGRAGDLATSLGQTSKTLRTVLQSGMLGTGAWLVIHGEATGGVMIASSIAMGRALAPIEIAIANWKPFLSARGSWNRLAAMLEHVPREPERLALERAVSRLSVEGLYVSPPGTDRPCVHNVTFAVQAGDALAVMGSSAAGKSSLARALVGAWAPTRGAVRLDGASLDQWDREALGANVGYLPQQVDLFDASIAANISRLSPGARAADVLKAAKAAGIHDMVVAMPEGYSTRLGEGGCSLSGGQRQRVGLARALFGDPFLVVLDEPNSNLDQEGDAALAEAVKGVRERGGVVVVVAHRPNVLSQATHVMIMRGGQIAAFGDREEVLQKMMRTSVDAPRPASEPVAAVRASA